MRTVFAYVLHYSFQAIRGPKKVEKYATTSTTISAVLFCFWVSYKSFLPSDVLLQICHEMHLKDADLSTSDANVQAQPDINPSGEHITAGFTNPTESTQVISASSAGFNLSDFLFLNWNHPKIALVPVVPLEIETTNQLCLESRFSSAACLKHMKPLVDLNAARRPRTRHSDRCPSTSHGDSVSHARSTAVALGPGARITAIKLGTSQTRLSLHFVFIKWAFLGTAGLLDGLPTFCVQRSL